MKRKVSRGGIMWNLIKASNEMKQKRKTGCNRFFRAKKNKDVSEIFPKGKIS